MRAWLKELRLARGFTQDEVAKLARIDRTYYNRIESGDRGRIRSLPVPTAKAIAQAIGFDWQRFYDESGAAV